MRLDIRQQTIFQYAPFNLSEENPQADEHEIWKWLRLARLESLELRKIINDLEEKLVLAINNNYPNVGKVVSSEFIEP